MRKALLVATVFFSITASAQINFGEQPDIKNSDNAIVYDGKHNIEIQNNNGKFNLKHLIGQEVTYLGLNDKVVFYVPDLTSEYENFKYKEIDPTFLRLKSFRIVDASEDWANWLCLFEKGHNDSIFANGVAEYLNTNFIIQKHYDLVKKTCIGKVYRETGVTRRIDFWRDYKTRKVHSSSYDNEIKNGTDLNCIDVFVDTVHYNVEMTPGNEDFADNLGTTSGSRLCLLFKTDNYGDIFCPVEEAEVLDPENAKNLFNRGPVLTVKGEERKQSAKIVTKSKRHR